MSIQSSISETPTPFPRPSGARRLTLDMRAALARADSFQGMPIGTAKPLRILAAFQEAEPYLGLPAHAFKLVSWLVKQTWPQDWEEGSRPIAWPSARRQVEFLQLSESRVKSLNRALYEAGIFVIRDNEQGKRYGRRDKDGRIVEAYGFDLSPLAQRYEEFIRLAAEAKIERDRMKTLRQRVTFARRTIRQGGEQLVALNALPADWPRLEADVAELIVAARRAERSETMGLIAKSLERRKEDVDKWVSEACQAVKTDPEGPENEPHITTTNLTFNPYRNTVIARRGDVAASRPAPEAEAPAPTAPSDPGVRIKPDQLVQLAPRLEPYLRSHAPLDWRAITDAADWMRQDLGISASLWHYACRVMGREAAAVAVALVSTKALTTFQKSPAAYYAGMVRKAEAGSLNMAGTIWALRDAKWAKPGRRLQ